MAPGAGTRCSAPRPGRATAPAVRAPRSAGAPVLAEPAPAEPPPAGFPFPADRSHRATWTAQSVRPASPNSRVPSSGSTIQTRAALSRAGSSAPSSDSTQSPGRSRASSVLRNSCAVRSPASRSSPGSPPRARSSTSRCPTATARSAARWWSSSDAIGGLLGVRAQSAWNVFCAAAIPLDSSVSTASAARSMTSGSSFRSAAEKSRSTKVAASIRPGGRPTPTRTRL